MSLRFMGISGLCGRGLGRLQGGLPRGYRVVVGAEQLQQAGPVARDDAAAGV